MLKWLQDAIDAGRLIGSFVVGKTAADFAASALLRSAVERQFMIVGEALTRIREAAPDVSVRIHESSDIVRFRNRLAHNYDGIDSDVVWRIVQRDLPLFVAHIEALRDLIDPDETNSP